MRIRPYSKTDAVAWSRMRTALWPDQTQADMAHWSARPDTTTLLAVEESGAPIGFIEVGERPFADGCETSPVAYLEGWWVDPQHREKGVGAALVCAAEEWARSRGLTEIASDAELDNAISHQAHEGLGFAEVSRAILYAKRL